MVLHPGGIYKQEQHGRGVLGWADRCSHDGWAEREKADDGHEPCIRVSFWCPWAGPGERVDQGAVTHHAVPAGSEATVCTPTFWPQPSFPARTALRWEQNFHLSPKPDLSRGRLNYSPQVSCPLLQSLCHWLSLFSVSLLLFVFPFSVPDCFLLCLLCHLALWSHLRFLPWGSISHLSEYQSLPSLSF